METKIVLAWFISILTLGYLVPFGVAIGRDHRNKWAMVKEH